MYSAILIALVVMLEMRQRAGWKRVFEKLESSRMETKRPGLGGQEAPRASGINKVAHLPRNTQRSEV